MKAEDWSSLKYHKNKELCEELFRDCPDQIDRIHYKDLSVESFIANYEIPNKPLIIQGLGEAFFPIAKYWTFEVSPLSSLILIKFNKGGLSKVQGR